MACIAFPWLSFFATQTPRCFVIFIHSVRHLRLAYGYMAKSIYLARPVAYPPEFVSYTSAAQTQRLHLPLTQFRTSAARFKKIQLAINPNCALQLLRVKSTS